MGLEDELKKEREEIELQRRSLEASCESEKSKLNSSLIHERKANYELRAESASLVAEKKVLAASMGHGTNTLILVSFALLVGGLIAGVGGVLCLKKKKDKDLDEDDDEDDEENI